ncbi:MAG: sulfatase [Verrucomicrobiota bacterium]
MSRNVFILFSLILATSVLWAKPRNVLFIAVDDLKPLLGCYGYEQVISPNIDKLAESGTTFLNAHCQQALCGPSRLSVLTGHFPDSIGIYGMSGDRDRFRLRYPTMATLPQHFRNNGFTTIGTGKIFDPRNLDGEWQETQDEASWTAFYGKNKYNEKVGGPKVSGHYHDPLLMELVGRLMDEGKEKGLSGKPLRLYIRDHGGGPAVESYDVPDDAYRDGAIANTGIVELEKLKDTKKPFFLALGFLKPHLPFVAPQKYWDLYDREDIIAAANQAFPEGAPDCALTDYAEGRTYSGIPLKGPISLETQRELIHGYMACVSYVDAQIGRVIAKLKEIGLYEETAIVLWGDHGFHLGDKQIIGKHTTYEEATRSPLIIANAGLKRGLRTNTPANLVDVYPTLCSIMGLKLPRKLDGKDLTSVLTGREDKAQEYAASIYPRNGYWAVAIRTEQYRYIGWYKGKRSESGSMRFEKKPEFFELYDYAADPLESKNLAGDKAYAKIEKRLAKLNREHVKYTQGRQGKL